MALSLKQRTFVEHYLGEANGNATEAARRAGYAGTDNVLAQMGMTNLAHPEIAALIKLKVDTLAMTADECLALLAEVARLPVDWLATLGKEAKITAGDKVRALELIGKYHKLWVDRTETQTTDVKRIEIISIQAVTPTCEPVRQLHPPDTIDGTAREI